MLKKKFVDELACPDCAQYGVLWSTQYASRGSKKSFQCYKCNDSYALTRKFQALGEIPETITQREYVERAWKENKDLNYATLVDALGKTYQGTTDQTSTKN